MGEMTTKTNTCEYALKCAAYIADSYTCTKDLDKSYCGIFRQFKKGRIKKYNG
jgi:hypothetical protein